MSAREPSRDVNSAYYGSISPGRDDYWRLMAAPRHRVATLLRELTAVRPTSVVDLGCGGGQLLAEVAKDLPAARRTGVDLSPAQIEANRRAEPGTEWQVLDLQSVEALPPALAGRFDAVVASELIEHLADPLRLLALAREMAAPSGAQLLLSTQSGPVRETERRVGHLRHFAAAEMTSLLASAGWEPLRVWNAGFPFHDLSKWWANRDPDASLSRFGSGAYGPAERAVCLLLRLAFRLNSSRRGAQLFAVAKAGTP